MRVDSVICSSRNPTFFLVVSTIYIKPKGPPTPNAYLKSSDQREAGMTDLQSFILFLSLGWITGAVTVTAVTVIKIKELISEGGEK